MSRVHLKACNSSCVSPISMSQIGIGENHSIFFVFHHQFNLVRVSVLASGGFSPLPITVAGDRTVLLLTKLSVNHH
jgi:hypothetical protein